MLLRPFWADQMEETRQREELLNEKQQYLATESGDESCQRISEIVFQSIKTGCGGLFWKGSVFFDVDFNDAVEDAYIRLGISSDEVPPPDFHDMGTEFEIRW